MNDYLINCLAMSIVNFTNETNNIDVDTRQKNNDKCFDHAVARIKEFLKEDQKEEVVTCDEFNPDYETWLKLCGEISNFTVDAYKNRVCGKTNEYVCYEYCSKNCKTGL